MTKMTENQLRNNLRARLDDDAIEAAIDQWADDRNQERRDREVGEHFQQLDQERQQ